jgi:DNA mismatch endonuclease (patch repair protein)
VKREGFELLLDPETSARLGRIRQKDTKPEQDVRKIITALGLRYRLNNRDLPGSPDIANRGSRWAIFVHGCFWHRHGGCKRTTTPKRNREFWEAKFRANENRDRRVFNALVNEGFRVAIIWECEAQCPEVVVMRLGSVGTAQAASRPLKKRRASGSARRGLT